MHINKHGARCFSPDQIFVYLLRGADVRINGVFILTELTPKTQVLEEAKQKLSPLLPPNHIVVLRLLVPQHLEQPKRS